MNTFRSCNTTILIGALSLFAGCGTVVTLHPQSSGMPQPPAIAIKEIKPKYVAAITYTRFTRDGEPESLGGAYVDGLLQRVREAAVFTSAHSGDQPIPLDQKAKLSLEVATRFDYNRLTNGIKGGLVSGSLFLLAPFLPFTSTFTASVRLRVEKPDGTFRDYVSIVRGDDQHLFFSHEEYYETLVTQVAGETWRALGSQLAQDRGWLQQ